MFNVGACSSRVVYREKQIMQVHSARYALTMDVVLGIQPCKVNTERPKEKGGVGGYYGGVCTNGNNYKADGINNAKCARRGFRSTTV